MSEHIERDIEAILEGRVGRGWCSSSGRFAIRRFPDFLSPGDRILMSQLEDAALLGGLTVSFRPVMAQRGLRCLGFRVSYCLVFVSAFESVFVITGYHTA